MSQPPGLPCDVISLTDPPRRFNPAQSRRHTPCAVPCVCNHDWTTDWDTAPRQHVREGEAPAEPIGHHPPCPRLRRSVALPQRTRHCWHPPRAAV